eukprot:5408915-Lingulodinium_polyedra.AAC.1
MASPSTNTPTRQQKKRGVRTSSDPHHNNKEQARSRAARLSVGMHVLRVIRAYLMSVITASARRERGSAWRV